MTRLAQNDISNRNIKSNLECTMKYKITQQWLALITCLLISGSSIASASVEVFEIEGLISPASPKNLISELTKQLDVKIVNLNLKDTDTGWPQLSVEFDSGSLSRADIEKAISEIEDNAGHMYRVHKGPALTRAPYNDEEIAAMAKFGPAAPDIVAISNPLEASDESIGQGLELFKANCATCHGLSGNGQGPAAHGIATFPRELWAWNNAPASTDAYLFGFITNGRNEMPPWGLILSENDRWE
jgi:mono/diheme cytochrome c family protein